MVLCCSISSRFLVRLIEIAINRHTIDRQTAVSVRYMSVPPYTSRYQILQGVKRLLARANGLANDDPRLIEVATLIGADVPVCLASRACDMTGVGETLLPLSLPIIPCVLVNPRVPVATREVFAALGLRNGELLVGFADVLQATAWPEEGASIEDWVEVLAANSNDLEAPATRIQPVIGEVLAALNATNGAWLARMSGSGATCFAIFENTPEAQRAAQKIQLDHPQWWVHAGVLS